MTDKIINATIEILGKFYSVRCAESEVPSLQQAAEYLNKKMTEVRESGKAINLERIAIISALNIANELLHQDQQKNGFVSKINERLAELQEKLDGVFNHGGQSELIYTAE